MDAKITIRDLDRRQWADALMSGVFPAEGLSGTIEMFPKGATRVDVRITGSMDAIADVMEFLDARGLLPSAPPAVTAGAKLAYRQHGIRDYTPSRAKAGM